MTEKELNNKLAKMGYTTLWLDHGILNLDFLHKQEQTFDSSDDQNTEHYRYQTFRRYLNTKNKLSDVEFSNYLELTFADNDPIMAGSAAVDLFNRTDLTEQQFQRLCEIIGRFGEWTEKIVTRQRLLRKLKASKLTSDLFEECIATGDSAIQEYILDIADVSQLQVLVLQGKNKKIRNIATDKLSKLTRQQDKQ